MKGGGGGAGGLLRAQGTRVLQGILVGRTNGFWNWFRILELILGFEEFRTFERNRVWGTRVLQRTCIEGENQLIHDVSFYGLLCSLELKGVPVHAFFWFEGASDEPQAFRA